MERQEQTQEGYLGCLCNNQTKNDTSFGLDSSRKVGEKWLQCGSVLKILRTRMPERANGAGGICTSNNKDRDSSSKNFELSHWEDEVTDLRWERW